MSKSNVFQFTSYQTKCNTFAEVEKQMESLHQELLGSSLENLRAFNSTYLIITKGVIARIGTNFFNNDNAMELFDTRFAQYYFDALKNYCDSRPTARAWEILFDSCLNNNLFQFQYMALGVNAHVNNDLALTLYDIKVNDYHDYLKINDVIAQSISSVVLSFHEKSPAIEYCKNNLRDIYRLILVIIIRKWRKEAWNNYKILNNHSGYKYEIELNAARIAKILSILH